MKEINSASAPRFFYDTEELRKKIEDETAIIGNRIKDGNGKSMIDEIAVSADNADIMARYCDDALSLLKERLLVFLGGDTENELSIQLSLCAPLSSPTIDIIDKKIEMYLIYMAVSWWFVGKGLGNEAVYYSDKANSFKSDIYSKLIQHMNKNGKGRKSYLF